MACCLPWARLRAVNVYHNDLFTDGDVLGGPSSQQAPGSPLGARPGTAQKMQQAKSSLAARRQERMQASVIERNETVSRGPGGLSSPAAPASPANMSRRGQQQMQQQHHYQADYGAQGGRSLGVTGDTYNGLRLSYDPNEESGEAAANTPTRTVQPRGQPSHMAQQQQQQQQQQPYYQQSLPIPAAPRLDLSDINAFLRQPGPKSGPVLCYIVRDKGSAKMYPRYNLFLEDGKKFLLAARKRKKQTTSNYIISLDYEDLGRDSEKFFGKLRSNFVGTDFTIFDNGDKEGRQNADGSKSGRQELGCIAYGYNVLGTRGPRKMTACIPAVDAAGNSLYQPLSEEDNMIERCASVDGTQSSSFCALQGLPCGKENAGALYSLGN